MNNFDKAIEKLGDDVLDRREFVGNFTKSLMKYERKDCLIIGLQGEWGSGKSSFINMTLDCLNQKINKQTTDPNSESFDLYEKPIILHFNPWYFSDQENLILQFFIELENILMKETNFTKKALNFLKTYALRITLDIVLLSLKGNSLKDYMNQIIKKIGIEDCLEKNGIYSIENENSINDIKLKLMESLSNINKKIIIIIDDMDRLLDEEKKLIFQLVKSIADFPNIIYILSFDKEDIINSLENIKVNHPEIFIEKIIQISIDIPKVSKSSLINLTDREITQIYESHEISLNDTQKKVIVNRLNLFFKNMRDLKRYCNLLDFYIPLAKNKLYVLDFSTILAIQNFDYILFMHLKNEKNLLTKVSFNERTNEKEKCREAIDSILKNESNLDYNTKKSIILKLFPNLKEVYGMNVYLDMAKWRRKGKICIADNFDKYFNFIIPDNSVSIKEMDDIIDSTYDSSSFKEKMILYSEKEKSHVILKNLKDYIDEIPIENLPTVIDVLMDIGDELYDEDDDEGYFPRDNEDRIRVVIKNLLMKIENQENRFKIIKNAFENSENSIGILISTISYLAIEHNKYGYSNDSTLSEENRIVNGEQLEKLKNILLLKIRKCDVEGKFLDSKNIVNNLYFWINVEEKDRIDQFIDKSTIDTEDALKFISIFITTTNHIPSDEEDDIKREYDIKGLEILKSTNLDLIKNRVEKLLENIESIPEDWRTILKKFVNKLDDEINKNNN
ncbi:MAG: KAP family NTPase [Methanobrevibacter sp.]|jgi:predicted KAP-like P-loop ATPase|nr:KAP family NTPase [Candidatus Methanoflexus mossambicus]